MNFSAANRTNFLEKADADYFDLLVVGGGITGAGIALDAVSRGLKTVLVEKTDFASGTSSRSTKLIHGGLRYLKQFEVGLVREVGKERAVVHQNARHLVVPEKMLLPIIEGGSLGKYISSFGLWVYDKLADVERGEQRQMFSKKVTSQLEPLLRTDILQGGGLYYEYRTDDARLVIEVLKSAAERGAVCVNYAEVDSFLYDDENHVAGATVIDVLSGKKYTVQARKVVNATGPWVDNIRKLDKEKISGKRLHLTKGVHIVVPKKKLPIKQAVYFDVMEDNRMMFAIPRAQSTYIGTTDTNYKENKENPLTTIEDVAYVLKAINEMFPSVKLTLHDVVSSWAGLRPLIHEDGKDPSELSRKDEIFTSKTGLISIAGGKLTGYRKMAGRITNLVVKSLKRRFKEYDNLKPCATELIQLSGGAFDSDDSLDLFIAEYVEKGKQFDLDANQVKSLVFKYGSNVGQIFERISGSTDFPNDPIKQLHIAELWYSLNHEMIVHLSDYLIRRTGRLYFETETLIEIYSWIGEEMGKKLNWNESQLLAELEEIQLAVKEVTLFKSKSIKSRK